MRPAAIVGASKIARDITHQKAIERALVGQAIRASGSSPNSAPVLIWLADATKAAHLDERNVAAVHRAQPGSGGWASAGPRTCTPMISTFLLTAYAPARSRPASRFRVEYRIGRHDREWRWLAQSARSSFESAEGFSGYVGSCADITDFRRAESEKEELLRAERAARK